MSKRKTKKNKIIASIISGIILLILIILGANAEVLNKFSQVSGLNVTFEESKQEDDNKTEFIADDNLKVYFIDVGQADSILVMNEDQSMLIDAGNNEDGEDVVKFVKDKGIQKLNYVIRNTSSRGSYWGIRQCD